MVLSEMVRRQHRGRCRRDKQTNTCPMRPVSFTIQAHCRTAACRVQRGAPHGTIGRIAASRLDAKAPFGRGALRPSFDALSAAPPLTSLGRCRSLPVVACRCRMPSPISSPPSLRLFVWSPGSSSSTPPPPPHPPARSLLRRFCGWPFPVCAWWFSSSVHRASGQTLLDPALVCCSTFDLSGSL